MAKKLQIYMKIGYFSAAIGLVLYILYTENVRIILFFSDIKRTEAYIKSWGNLAPLMFVFIQSLQVILFFIPGEFIQISGGFLFGTIFGSMLSVIGMCIGTLISFQTSRILGGRFLDNMLKSNEYAVIKKLLLKTENRVFIFVLYLIPGFPKDILGYILGMTKINIKVFLALSLLGRLPGIIVSGLIGQNIHNENYVLVIYLIIVSGILLLVFYKKRNLIIKYMNSKTQKNR